MDRKIAIIIVLIVVLIMVCWRQKEIYELEITDEVRTSPVENKVSIANTPEMDVEGRALPQAHVDLYQGVEVHLDSINWEGLVFNASNDNGVVALGGVNDFKINKIIFNPDPRTVGYPELVITAGAPKPLVLSKFVNELLGYEFSPAITNALSKQGPYESKEWLIRNDKGDPISKAKMDIWLMEFSLIIDAKPSRNVDLSPRLAKMISPITGIRNSALKPEYKNQRYGNLDIILKLTPAQEMPILNGVSGQKNQKSHTPHFAIAALEVASVKYLGDKEHDNADIGAYVEKGESLALYDRPVLPILSGTSVLRQSDYLSSQPNLMIQQLQAIPDRSNSVNWSESVFDKDRYAYIHLANFGSWRDGAWYASKVEWADKIDIHFVMHVFAVGEWELKRPTIVGKIQASERIRKVIPSPFAFLIPSFFQSGIGRYLLIASLVIASIVILGIFFPPLIGIFNSILQVFSQFIKRSPK